MNRPEGDRVVLIYDAPPAPGAVAKLAPADVLELFPLTSSWNATAAWMAAAEAAPGIAAVELADTPRALDDEARRLRTRLRDWGTALGRAEIAGVSLRRRLIVHDAPVSGWWFTPLAERNPLVSRFIARLAQIGIVDRRLTASGGRVAMAVADPALSTAVQESARLHGRPVSMVARPPVVPGALERLSLALEPVKAAVEIARVTVRALAAQSWLGPYAAPESGATLFVTYFPALDARAAEHGEFRDRYLGAVSELIRQRGEPSAWLLLPQPIDGATFGDALRQARRFLERERMATWHQVLTARAFRRAIGRWWRQARIYRRFRREIDEAAVAAFGLRAARPILATALRKAFFGARSVQAFLLHAAFEAVFSRSRVGRAIYCAEFQPWEAALCAAAAAGGVKTIGFQHTTVPPNLYNYARHPLEFDDPPAEGGMPLPRLVAANGDRPAKMLREAGLPCVRVVEAVRHAGIRELLDAAPAGRAGTLVVLVGSIDGAETRAMLELAGAARVFMPDATYVFRPHPLMSALPTNGWMTTADSVKDLLQRASAAIVPSSSVAVEALACGCPVVQPVFAGVLSTAPLDAQEGWHFIASTPQELAAAVRSAMAGGRRPAGPLVEAMWRLGDPLLPRWSEVLERA